MDITLPSSKLPPPPATRLAPRWKVSIVLGVSFFIAMLDRMNISYALPLIAQEFDWDPEQKRYYGSWLIGLFYFSYGLSNLLLTPLASKFGPRKTLLCIVCLWSVFTAMGAVFSQILMVFMASRILLGFAEGVHIPMMNQLMKNWYPATQRSRGSSVWFIGLFIAIVMGPLILVPLMANFGWRAGFHVLALFGLGVSLPLIYWFIHDHPSKIEDQAILDPVPSTPEGEPIQKLWPQLKPLVFRAKFLLAVGTGIANNMVAVGVLVWFPSFLESRQDVSYEQLSYLGATPYFFSILSLPLWAWLGDRYNARARNASIGFVVAAVTLLFGFNQESLTLTIGAFCVGVFFITAFSACEHPIIQHIFPAHLVVIGSGIYNGLAMTLGSVLGTISLGKIMADASQPVNIWPLMFIFATAALLSYLLGRKANY